MTVISRIRNIIAANLDVALDRIAPEAELVRDLGADSLGLSELAVKVEREFGLKIPDEQLVRFRTVKDVEAYVAEKSRSGR